MNPFLKIIKEVLVEQITAICTLSRQTNDGLVNQARDLASLGRDRELSAAKCDLLEMDLLPSINGFVEQNNDKTNLTHLQALIEDCRKKVLTKSGVKGYGEGTTEPALQKLIDLSGSIFEKLLALGVLKLTNPDVPYTPQEGDPLYVFHYFLAKYLVNKVVAVHYPGTIHAIVNYPKVTTALKALTPFTPKDLANQKELLVVSAFKECKVDIERLREDRPDFQAAKLKAITTCIDKLRRDNKTLCTANAIFPGPFFQPSPGDLETCMVAALTEITNPPSVAPAPADKLATNTSLPLPPIPVHLVVTGDNGPLAAHLEISTDLDSLGQQPANDDLVPSALHPISTPLKLPTSASVNITEDTIDDPAPLMHNVTNDDLIPTSLAQPIIQSMPAPITPLSSTSIDDTQRALAEHVPTVQQVSTNVLTFFPPTLPPTSATADKMPAKPLTAKQQKKLDREAREAGLKM